MAKIGAQTREQRFDLSQVGDIAASRDRPVADFPHRRAQGVRIAPGDDDLSALGGERFRRGVANATVAADSDRDSTDKTLSKIVFPLDVAALWRAGAHGCRARGSASISATS
jgi:hypothetical protein